VPRARLHPAEPERPFRDHDAQRERAARQALAIGAVARIDQLRLFGDLIADRAALAAAGMRELHRPFLSGLVEGWCPGAELNHRHTDFQSALLACKPLLYKAHVANPAFLVAITLDRPMPARQPRTWHDRPPGSGTGARID